MKILSTLTSVVVLLIASISVSAGIRPSFSLESSAWRATDIIIVTEDQKIDGVFKILETLKGDLQPGETITISEMEEFKNKEARLVDSGWLSGKEKGSPPEYVTCERMILFLRDATRIPKDEDEDTRAAPSNNSRWQPANPFGSEVKYSTVWIENGKAYWFMQLMNPGPSLLYSVRTTETELKSQVSHVLSTQASLNAALAIPDLKTRAEGLEPFAQDSLYLARKRTFAGLKECGEAALPVLRRMLSNELLSDYRADVIETFAAAGGSSAGPELTAWLERELQFWMKTGPTLRAGWWNGEGFESINAVEPLRTRYIVLHRAIKALGETRYVEASRVVREVGDLWRSLPQFSDDQVTTACDQVLRELAANNKGDKRPLPKYEVKFTGNKAFSSTVLREKLAEYFKAWDALESLEDIRYSDMFGYAETRLLDFILSQGYVNVGFNIARYSTEGGVLISIEIDEGRQYRLGKVTIEGAKLFSAEQIRARLTLREGELADAVAINKWLNKDVREAYNDAGYLYYSSDRDYEFSAKSKRDEPGTADLKVTINEGPQFKVGAIKFDGKTTIEAARLSAAVSLREGDLYTRKQLDDSIDELNKLGLSLDKKKDVTISPDHTASVVKIVIFLNKDR